MVQEQNIAEPEVDLNAKVVIFPAHIPVEILRYILEIAARLDRHVTARNIVLSSKLLRSWIDPILYQEIILHTKKAGTALVSSIQARLPSDPLFFSRRVKYITITSQVTPETIDYTLGICTGVTHISLLTLEDTDPDMTHMSPQILSLERLTHFSCYFIDIRATYPVEALSPSITHLTLCYEETVVNVDWSHMFTHCPKLSHLLVCFPPETREEIEEFRKTSLPGTLAQAIWHAHPDPSPETLSIVFAPVALLVSAMLPIPRDWASSRSAYTTTGSPDSDPTTTGRTSSNSDTSSAPDDPKYMFIHPRTLLDDLPDSEVESVILGQLDATDLEPDDSSPTFAYLASRFRAVEAELWDYVEGEQKKKCRGRVG